MSGATTIVREAPRARRRSGWNAAGFVLPAPSFDLLIARAWHEARVASRAHRGLLLGLALAGALLWPLTLAGLALIVPLPATFHGIMPTLEEITRWYALAGLCAGALSGLAQALVLRRTAGDIALWAPMTALGWSLSMVAAVRGATEVSRWLRAAFDTARFTFWAPEWERYAVLSIVGAFIGLALGTAQWIALRMLIAPLSHRTIWIAATTLAWSAGLAFVPVMPRTPDFIQRAGRYSGGFDYTITALILAGALYGLLTGFALTLLLRRAAPQPLET